MLAEVSTIKIVEILEKGFADGIWDKVLPLLRTKLGGTGLSEAARRFRAPVKLRLRRLGPRRRLGLLGRAPWHQPYLGVGHWWASGSGCRWRRLVVTLRYRGSAPHGERTRRASGFGVS